jgi:hypothetical protein
VPVVRGGYLAFVLLGFAAVLVTRLIPIRNKVPVIVLAVVHGIAGLTITLLPVLQSVAGRTSPGFALVGLGGALIGIAGLLLSFLKAGHPLVSRSTILRLLPGLLLLMTGAFVAGFRFA